MILIRLMIQKQILYTWLGPHNESVAVLLVIIIGLKTLNKVS